MSSIQILEFLLFQASSGSSVTPVHPSLSNPK